MSVGIAEFHARFNAMKPLIQEAKIAQMAASSWIPIERGLSRKVDNVGGPVYSTLRKSVLSHAILSSVKLWDGPKRNKQHSFLSLKKDLSCIALSDSLRESRLRQISIVYGSDDLKYIFNEEVDKFHVSRQKIDCLFREIESSSFLKDLRGVRDKHIAHYDRDFLEDMFWSDYNKRIELLVDASIEMHDLMNGCFFDADFSWGSLSAPVERTLNSIRNLFSEAS